MSVVTRFAPSPTGMLHIGGARTALFNYLYARHNNGKFLLRIEDTDKKRSTKEAIDAIINGLSWLGINHDEEIVFQSRRVDRHCEVAHELLKLDRAYYCYCTEDDIEKHKLQCETSGETYRHACSINPDKSKLPVIRFRSPNFGKTIFYDGVYGDIIIDNKQLDDLIILRSDGTPTYIFAVVVDDHDMGITQIIRGTDHLTNTSRHFNNL